MPSESWMIEIRGYTQGIGLRPELYRLAKQFRLTGTVGNAPLGVLLHLDGEPSMLQSFVQATALRREIEITHTKSERSGEPTLRIVSSVVDGGATVLPPPDLGVCPECLDEVFDPESPRYCYPFTTCSQCGPRYSIIESLPFDRERTVMRDFPMCDGCQAEYEDPENRRFHCQGMSCPECGPTLQLLDERGRVISSPADAIYACAELLSRGAIVAVKGIGGFHLFVDARNNAAVLRLRRKKVRPTKPFAVMAPSLEWVRGVCSVESAEERALSSAARPIVLLRRETRFRILSSDSEQRLTCDEPVARAVAHEGGPLGVVLPYTPLHALLLDAFGGPLVCTSANVSGGALILDFPHDGERKTDVKNKKGQLHRLADAFLTHNRRIVEGVEDSVCAVVQGEVTVIRNARGFSPYSVKYPARAPMGVQGIALGGEEKNALAVTLEERIGVLPQGGSLRSVEAERQFHQRISRVKAFYSLGTGSEYGVACDLHPSSLAAGVAGGEAARPSRIQHHYAHALSCLWENNLQAPALAAVWDGTGAGGDGSVWGGEWLLLEREGFSRFSHLHPFQLIGGEAAVSQPRRSALSLLLNAYPERAPAEILARLFHPEEAQSLIRLTAAAPRTTSMGRLFDGVGALVGLPGVSTYEGEVPSLLENLLSEVSLGRSEVEPYPYALRGWAPIIVDWRPLIREVVNDVLSGVTPPVISARFHHTLVTLLLAVSRKAESGYPLLLSGGCFQNRALLEGVIAAARRADVPVYWHRQVPTNDGGIAIGQLAAMMLNAR